MAIDPDLLRVADEEPEKPLSVVVSLERPELPTRERSRKELIEDRRAAFDDASASVRELISQFGGAVTDEAWLSSSLRATVPAGALRAVEAADGVRGVDVPTGLRREEAPNQPGVMVVGSPGPEV